MALRALIIANERFADAGIPPLSSPVSDGRRLKALLERDDVGGYEVELCDNASSVDARDAVQAFFDSGEPDDLQLLILSGHGLKDRWSRLHFATSDTKKARLAASSLEARFVRDRMDDGRAGRKILIIDACYSGAFLEGMVPKKAGALEISREDFGDRAARGVSIVTASTAVQLAGEKDVDGTVQSVFTRCMIEGIETGAADGAGKGVITLSDLFDHVSRRMREEAPGQTPQCLDLSHGGSMTIARNPAWRPATLPDDVVERVYSKDRHARVLAVEDLAQLIRAGDAVAPKAMEALRLLAQDDSVAVQHLARVTLDQLGAKPDADEWQQDDDGDDEPEDVDRRRDEEQKDEKDDGDDGGEEEEDKSDLSGGGQQGGFLVWLSDPMRRLKLVAGAALLLVALLLIVPRLPWPPSGPADIDPSPIADDPPTIQQLRKSCVDGSVSDCAKLGTQFNNGEGIARNATRAAIYYGKACDGRDGASCTNLGFLHAQGSGMPVNEAAAVDYYDRGCSAGEPTGCSNLATRYENGQGVAKDIARAAQLYTKSCEGGYADACTSMGVIYENGTVGAKDAVQAVAYYRRACDKNNARGCAFLGENLYRGLGVVRDEVEARRQLDSACTAGYAYGCKKLKEFFPPVTVSDILGNISNAH